MHLKHFRLTVYHWLLSLTSCWLWSKKTKLLRKSWTSSTRMAFPSTIAGERTWYVWHELIRNHERTINKLKNSVTQLRLAKWGVNDKRWHLPIFWVAKLEMSQIVRQKVNNIGVTRVPYFCLLFILLISSVRCSTPDCS